MRTGDVGLFQLLHQEFVKTPWAPYIPFDIEYENARGEAKVLWVQASGSDFHDPFFRMTIRRLIQEKRKRTISSPLRVLACSCGDGRLQPTGFIYHASRCRSTLIANMLAALDEHFVLSEPYLASNLMFEIGSEMTETEWLQLIRANILTLGRIAPIKTKRFFIKLFSGAALQIQWFRKAFPAVREIFIYREPTEIVMSMVKEPWARYLWLEQLIGVDRQKLAEVPLAELAARMVGRSLNGMLEHLRKDTLLLNHSEIGVDTPPRLLEWCDCPITAKAIERMAGTQAVYSKDRYGKRLFDPRKETHARDARSVIVEEVAKYATEPYRALETERLARRPE